MVDPQKRKARVVERTDEHSSSLALTKHMDNEWNAGLGNLSRLPLEVRRRIYDCLMTDTCRPHFNRTVAEELYFKLMRTLVITEHTRYDRYEAGIFDFRLHNGDCGNQCSTSRSLRLQHTSSALRNEYRENLLSSTCFKFIRPATAVGFLTYLTAHDKLQLRRLALMISEGRDSTLPRGDDSYNQHVQWKWVCRVMPPTLTLITIDTMGMWTPPRWRRVEHPGQDFPPRQVMDVFLDLQCALLTTEVICKEIKARALKAKFELGPCHINYEACFRAVMAEYN